LSKISRRPNFFALVSSSRVDNRIAVRNLGLIEEDHAMSRGNFKNLQAVLVAVMVLGLSIGLTGCSDDNSPVTVPTTGSISVDVTPDDIGVSWVLSSQDKLLASVQGDSTFSSLAPGIYTLTWGNATGWSTPTPGTVEITLQAGDQLSYSGTYAQVPGTIVIDVNDDSLDAPWTLTKPGNVDVTGNGDATFTDMPVGSYVMTWGDVLDYTTPGSEQLAVLDGGTVTFTGTYTYAIPNGFVMVDAGSFTMGAPVSELGREGDEVEHAVTLTDHFLMSKYEVTQAMWDEYMGGSSFSTMPKTGVNWDQAVAFCNAMSVAEGYTPAYTINGSGNVTWNRDANGFRLPTEAEWEYACRAGSDGAFPAGQIAALFCEEDANLDAAGWYCYNSDAAAHLVGMKSANDFGLYDMNGNVWEWCWDAYTAAYEDLGATDPVNDGGAGDSRVVRSGGYLSYSHFCRAAARSMATPTLAHSMYGLRVVKTMP